MPTFKKLERLCSRSDIADLYKKGEVFYHAFFKITYQVINLADLSKSTTQVLIVVPKKNISLAHNRNKIKRQIREIYRNQKFQLQNPSKQIRLSVIYNTTNLISFTELQMRLIESLQKINSQVKKTLSDVN